MGSAPATGVPTMNSCPTRCSRVNPAIGSGGVGVGVGLGVGLGDAVEGLGAGSGTQPATTIATVIAATTDAITRACGRILTPATLLVEASSAEKRQVTE